MNFIMPSAKATALGTIISFDTEAKRYYYKKKEYQRFYNGDFFNGQEHIYTTDLEQFYVELEGLVTDYGHVTVIGHNIGYDIQIIGLMNHVKNKHIFGIPLKIAIIEGVVYIKFQGKNKSIAFLDTFNYFKTSLANLGKSIGFKKVNEEEYDLAPSEWNKQLEVTGEARVKKDTEILYKYFMKFATNNDFVLGISIASTSFKIFKEKFLNRVITIPTDHLEPSLLSYRGGRTEAYLLNENPVYAVSYDINSLYPYVMKNYRYSYKFHKKINKINWDDIENGDYNYLFNVDYSFSEEFNRLPVMIKRTDKKLVQSYTGKNVWLTGNELLEMYKHDNNLLIGFINGLEYHSDFIFKDYVDYFYNKRLEASDYERDFYKYMLNTPYGKFGQHKAQTRLYFKDDLELADLVFSDNKKRVKQNGKVFSFHDGFMTTKEEFEKKKMYSPLIASEITANARLVNWYYQKHIGFDHVFYTDTDSFFIDKNLEMSDKLGGIKIDQIKIDGEKYDKKGKFIFYGNKDYSLELENGKKYTVLKGIPKRAVRLAPDYYELTRFSSLMSNEKNGQVVVTKVRKKLTRKKDKMRYISSDNGYIGLPFFKIE